MNYSEMIELQIEKFLDQLKKIFDQNENRFIRGKELIDKIMKHSQEFSRTFIRKNLLRIIIVGFFETDGLRIKIKMKEQRI
jgi:hypothetical protein